MRVTRRQAAAAHELRAKGAMMERDAVDLTQSLAEMRKTAQEQEETHCQTIKKARSIASFSPQRGLYIPHTLAHLNCAVSKCDTTGVSRVDSGVRGGKSMMYLG